MKNVYNYISNLKNTLGWKCKKKYVVLESDDWGSCRFRNLEAVEHYKKTFSGEKLSKPIEYDTFVRKKDFEYLANVLVDVKDSHEKSPCVTMFINPANPDFESIHSNNFSHYVPEPITALDSYFEQMEGESALPIW